MKKKVDVENEKDLVKFKKAFNVCEFVISTQADQLYGLEESFGREIKNLKKQLVRSIYLFIILNLQKITFI